VLLGHPGGPFFAKRDEGIWSIPKGRIEEGEAPLTAALREFEEETGIRPEGKPLPLGHIEQRGGKIVHGWALEWGKDPLPPLRSNTFEMEWPPSSGKIQRYQEIDEIHFFTLEDARVKMNVRQATFLERLVQVLRKN
jgi:predicted NUDIX family NTP pyrophosphohydrolase